MSKDTHFFYTNGDIQFKNNNFHLFCGRQEQMIYDTFSIQHSEFMIGIEAQKAK